MLKAVKESLKNWLVTHERLYWYIVVGLAVLGFGIVTALGCVKLEQANAATTEDGTFYYDLWTEVDWGSSEHYKDVIYTECSYVIVSERSNGQLGYYLSVSPNECARAWSSNGYRMHSVHADYLVNVTAGKVDGVSTLASITSFNKTDPDGLGTEVTYTVIASNYDYRGDYADLQNLPYCNMEYAVLPEYSLDAPYIKFDSLDIYCPLATSPQTFKQNADITEIYKDYENWYWQYNGTIVNNSDIVPEEYTLSIAFTVQLPTYDYVSELHVLGVVRQYLMPKNVPASVKEWMATDTDFVEYTFSQEFVLDVASDGTFSLKIPYSVIHGLMVYAYPDLLETFGTCTESDIDFCDIWMAHLYVEQCDSLLTVTSGGNKYYGRSVMNIFSKGIINRAVTAEVLVDILNATDAELESAISDALKIGYDEALKQNQADMDNMQNDLDSIFEVDGAFSGNLEGTDLWSGFSNLSEGLASLGPSIKQLSSLTGSVFAFIPAPIASIISFTLFAICIIAIIKAIRG